MRRLFRRKAEKKKNGNNPVKALEREFVSLEPKLSKDDNPEPSEMEMGPNRIYASMNDVSGTRNDAQLLAWMENDAKAKADKVSATIPDLPRFSTQITNGGNIQRPIAIWGSNDSELDSPKHPIAKKRESITSKFSKSMPIITDDIRQMSDSPSLISISQILFNEKNDLVSLNDRFAVILVRNSQLEHENAFLSTRLYDANAKLTLITSDLSATFRVQRNALQTKCNKTLKEKTKWETRLEKLQTEFNALNERRTQQEENITMSTQKIKALRATILNIRMELENCDDECGKLTREKRELSQSMNKALREVERAQQENEMENTKKIEIENTLKSKGDEVDMKIRIHQEQISDLSIIRNDYAAEYSRELKSKYALRLQGSISQLRLECGVRLQANQEIQEVLYMRREEALQKELALLQTSLELKAQDMEGLIFKLEKKLRLLAAQKSAVENRLLEVQEEWAKDKAAFDREKAPLEAQIEEMEAERVKLLTDYEKLTEIKFGLDSEILAYKSIVDSEEERLNHLEDEGFQISMNDQITNTIDIKESIRSASELLHEYTQNSGDGNGDMGILSSGVSTAMSMYSDSDEE